MTIKNELVLKIFVNTTKNFLQKLVASFDFLNHYNIEYDILMNNDYDADKSKIFPDGFLRFSDAIRNI